jgi:cellulose synthase/poly-beta-1,6-N-acetylglucosamine synthase-like glycosyltransferase
VLQAGFVLAALWRAVVAIASLRPSPLPMPPKRWPRYTVMAALHDEAAVVPQLIQRLSRIDYPRRQLEGFLILEAHDQATLNAAMVALRPAWLKILVVPQGSPQTKPRALNHALSVATGELITIYDAEDAPDSGQLREAAARFAQEPRLGCLQAPLRIRRNQVGLSSFLDRQFAFEYAALFEVNLPGLARLRLPFPLGGTSNHVRMTALRGVGGWDAHNVTEDADLGFRLWTAGWGLGVLNSPTWETPPGGLERWLPQRTRWLKGYMQTWGVQTRAPLALGRRGLLSLVMTLGAAIVSAACHAPTVAWLASALMLGLHAGIAPAAPLSSFVVLALGVVTAWMGCAVGARRAGMDYRLTDMLAAPAYWSLLSLAFVHAFWRLIVAPHVWDKTVHDAEIDVECAPVATLDAGREAA